MSSTGPKDSIEGIEDVTRAYRDAACDEQPPPHLDRAILAAARRRPKPRLAAFIPAFALAATVVLSFSIMLRSGLLGIGGVEAPLEQGPASALESRPSTDRAESGLAPDSPEPGVPPPTGGFADAPQEEGLSSPPALRLERALSEDAAAQRSVEPAAPDGDLGMTAPAESRSITAQDSLGAQALEAEAVESATRRSRFADETDDCRVASDGDPEDWLACIGQRLADGARERARSELDAFASAHPDYPLPQDLQALRGSQPR